MKISYLTSLADGITTKTSLAEMMLLMIEEVGITQEEEATCVEEEATTTIGTNPMLIMTIPRPMKQKVNK